ncbi:nicotinate phosphoribosyltransferase [Agrobacterium phage Atu_ph07]|uniref:nicotinate phosphoribosyltransferase n=1 Tax=Agrobacterium phage Atu_ph07 TaxID=2024264 RepID=A0A2L0UZQ6_9CAUD|nr:nicotinate phosphoribosyltransferase [Agrobacterium phage Atu_ph07]AUZ95024.1 nicotinate phosphoribosyltransferase [Agrobacterium phage Atu_ph07]
MIDIATRVHNHNYKIDPIVRSLLDTDFYKFSMLQLIWIKYRHMPVTFFLNNRTKSVRLSDSVDIHELREQLKYVQNLSFTKSELIWLQGNTFYGRKGMFDSSFIEFLRTFRLPDFNLEMINDEIVLEFHGSWADVTLWEIYALSIVNELRVRHTLNQMTRSELDILYARAKTRIYDNLVSLNKLDNLKISDFGTRRRHGFLWQEWVVQVARDVLGNKFVGTSNAFLAMKHDLEAIGTNAHELPMTLATTAKTNSELKESQYKVLIDWMNTYNGNMLIALPDTFGTTQFLNDAPDFLNDWKGFRVDSKNPIEAGYEYIKWWSSRGIDPMTKLCIFSDGLDTRTIHELYNEFNGKMQISFGWGTNLTNDFKGLLPVGNNGLDPISLVCKVKEANGLSAVKLSDNYEKATGSNEQVTRYRNVFGNDGVSGAPLIV